MTLSTHKKLGADGKVSYIRERWTSEGGYQRCGATSLEVNYGMSGFPDEAMSVNGQPCVIPYADRLVSGLAHEGWSCALSEFGSSHHTELRLH